MKTYSFIARLVFTFLLVPFSLFAFPDHEQVALSLGTVTSQATSFISQNDRYLFLSFGNVIRRIDTQNFELTTDQVPSLTDNSSLGGNNLTGDVGGMAVRSNSLYASQSDGDLLTINLDNITAEPGTFHVSDGALGPLVADTEGGSANNKLYIIDKANNAVLIFDIATQTSTSIALVDGGGSQVSPVALVFVPFPTILSLTETDKVYVTTNRGLIYVIQEGATTAVMITLTPSNTDLPAAAVTPDGDYLLVVDSTGNVVHVIDTATDTEVDTDTTLADVNPIPLPKNGSLREIVITDVTNPTDTYAFVTGSAGVSVIDLNVALGAFSSPIVFDFSFTGSGDVDNDPLVLSSAPGPIIASSVGDGYVYTSNSNATISVITDNPFVNISSTSLGSSSLTTTTTFTVTFQSDMAGTYRILVGGDSSANGQEVTSGTVGTAATDVTSAEIAYDASVFAEGTNRIFVFVTDTSGNVGRDAVDINVDTPPGELQILETGFGDQKIYLTFTRLTAADIDHYNIYLDIDPTVVGTKTDVAATLSQSDSGDTIESKVIGLINGVTYYIGLEGVDTSGNLGVRTTTFSDGTPAWAMPEATIGLTGITGEKGCGLMPGSRAGQSWAGYGLLVLGCVVLVMARYGRRLRKMMAILLVGSLLLPMPLHAEEKTPKWWSLELKGGVWLPRNSTTRDFLGLFSPTGLAEFGFLYHSRYGAEVGVGYVGAGGFALGTSSGAVSRDRFDFTMIPISNSFAFRADFLEDQLFVPYVKVGPDFVIYRENNQGHVTSGLKLGLHGALGLQILLDRIDDLSIFMEDTMRVNDVYFVIEGRYAWVNNFGGRGLSLSNLTASAGLLFEF